MMAEELVRLLAFMPPKTPVYVSVNVPDGVFIGPMQVFDHDPEIGVTLSYSEEKANQIPVGPVTFIEEVPPATGGT